MATIRMATVEEFQDPQLLDAYLGEQLTSNRLTLVLGAGISKAFGLPDWSQLLSDLYAEKKERLPETDLKRQAEYLRNKYYDNATDAFMEAVRGSLYQKVDTSYQTMRRCDTLAAVAALAMNSRRGSASQLITFNWDDLLETYLEYHGFVTEIVTSDRHWATTADVTVFHPHGFLPFHTKRERSKHFVFDQRSYTSIMGDAGRLWRQTLTSVMRCRTCIFVGLSGADDNLDLLLQECEASHASSLEHAAYWGVIFTTSTDEADMLFWKNRLIFPVVISDYNVDLPQRLFRIPQAAAGS